MNYALIKDGVVINLIWLRQGNESDFPNAVACGDVHVNIGDTYDGQYFYCNGNRLFSPLEEAQNTIRELDTALLEAQYQLLAGGFEE